MTRIKVVSVLLVLSLVIFAGCSSKSNYEKELMGKVWVEESGGNNFEYTFASETEMKVLINEDTEWVYNISRVIDEERKFIVYAEKSMKYKQVFWNVKDASNIEISQLVGGEYYDVEDDAAAAPMDTKWMPLTVK